MRVVVDTSVLVEAAVNPSSDSYKILDLLERRFITPVFNEASWDELVYTLPRTLMKFHGYDPDQTNLDCLPIELRNLIGLWLWAFDEVYCAHRLVVDREDIGDYIVDPDDEKIIAAGLNGCAWFIIHEDKHFDEVPPLVVVPDGHELLCCRPGEFAAAFPDWLKALRLQIKRRLAS